MAARNGKTKLNSNDHKLLDAFLAEVLDRYKSGKTDRDSAVGLIAHLVAAIDLPDGADHRAYMQTVVAGEDIN
jgi:hypothetical protein